MIKMHSTKKLLAKLPLDTSGTLPNPQVDPEIPSNSDSLLGDWHANLLILQSVNCVLLVHDATRFPVFVKELRKSGFAKLARYFEDGYEYAFENGCKRYTNESRSECLATVTV